jgi:hypothetical protein
MVTRYGARRHSLRRRGPTPRSLVKMVTRVRVERSRAGVMLWELGSTRGAMLDSGRPKDR